MHDPYDEFDAREMRFERAENARPYDDSGNPASVENRCIKLPAADVCEDWLETLARANDEAGSVPTRE